MRVQRKLEKESTVFAFCLKTVVTDFLMKQVKTIIHCIMILFVGVGTKIRFNLIAENCHKLCGFLFK